MTPVGVSYDDGFYYLTAWNESHGNLTEYRIDRMARVRVLEDASATRNDEIARYRYNDSKGVMFGRFNTTIHTTPAHDSCTLVYITLKNLVPTDDVTSLFSQVLSSLIASSESSIGTTLSKGAGTND